MMPAPAVATGYGARLTVDLGALKRNWQALDKKDLSFIAPPLIEVGVAVAVVNYALCPAMRVGEVTVRTGATLRALRALLGFELDADSIESDASGIGELPPQLYGRLAALALV